MKNFAILIIDDIANRDILKHLTLNMNSNEIILFEDGEEALLHLDQEAEALDQVLIFFGLPVFQDLFFLEKLQNKDYKHKVNVLIMSTSPALEINRKFYRYPQVMGFLEKGMAPEILMEIVDFFENNQVIPSLEKKADSAVPLMIN